MLRPLAFFSKAATLAPSPVPTRRYFFPEMNLLLRLASLHAISPKMTKTEDGVARAPYRYTVGLRAETGAR
jgi:hypothetical protein